MEKSSENKEIPKPYAFTMQRMISFATEFGFIIALPVVAFGLGGRWLDGHTHHEHLYTLLGILLALITSTIFLGRRINQIRKELTKSSTPPNLPLERGGTGPNETHSS